MPNPSPWQRVVDTWHQYEHALSDFLTSPTNKVDVLRTSLRSKERNIALAIVPSLNVEEKKSLFAEWVNLARAHCSPFNIAWNIIESLPRDWVLERIEKEADTILAEEEETDYWMFLQLYARLDKTLTKRLAERAAHHADPDIRELGEEYAKI